MAIPPNTPGPSRAEIIYIPVAVFAVVSPLLVGLRVWSRLRKGGKLGPDDYVCVASLLFALATGGVMVAACHYGYGQHVANLRAGNKMAALRFFYIQQITYKLSINLIKISIALLYLRIFGTARWFRHAVSLIVLLCALYCAASVLATIFQCIPVARMWDKSIPGSCIDTAAFYYANAAFSIATDVVLLVLPMPLVWQLQISYQQKIALLFVFMLGGFVVVTSCLRTTTLNSNATTADPTWDIASTMWTILEMNIAVVCACLPMIRPLVARVVPFLLDRSSDAYRRYGHGAYGKAGARAAFGSKGYVPSGSCLSRERGDTAGGISIRMSAMRKGDQSSEEYILHDREPDKERGSGVRAEVVGGGDGSPRLGSMGIQKTVQYSVEYGKEDRDGAGWAA